MIHAVILAGGKGERFWPLSREARAKQFLSFGGGESLLAAAVKRLEPLVPAERMTIVTGRSQRALAREAAPKLTDDRILGEPFGRNTAPAVALGAVRALKDDPDALLVVVPSDAWVGDDAAWRAAVESAARHAADHDSLGTIGIVPTRPETGYGYLELEAPVGAGAGVTPVSRFVEKPDAATAARWLAGGRHLWNGGIFVMRAKVFCAAVDRHLPELGRALDAVEGRGSFDDAALDAYYAAAPSISIDYGVMEKAESVFTVPGRFPWDDLGSWSALERIREGVDGVVSVGRTLAIDSPGSIIYADEGIAAVLGLPGVVVVRAGNAVLVLPKEKAQEVRKIVQALAERPDGKEFR